MSLVVSSSPESAHVDDTIIIDALAYIDREYTDQDMKSQVDALIQEECGRSTKSVASFLRDIEARHPDSDRLSSPLLQSELDRIASGAPSQLTSIIDLTRHNKIEPPPPEQHEDIEAWKRAIQHAEALVEHQHTRLINLELLQKYGSHAWKAHAESLDAMKTSYESLVDRQKQEIENINRKRKADQMGAYPALENLTHRWYELAHKNNEIEIVCQQLESTIKRYKQQAKQRGLLPADPPTTNGDTSSSTTSMSE